MTVTLHNIAGTDAPFGYHHASVARGTTIVHLAGQVGASSDGVVAEGLAAQTEQAMLNVAKALDAAGARVEDLVKSTIYIAAGSPRCSRPSSRVRWPPARSTPFPTSPLTLIGVHSLFDPSHLVEIEAVAVLDAGP